MSPDVLQGLAQAGQLLTLAATGVGVLLGLIVGMIPGLTISTGIIVLLPVTFVLPPDISIALLLGLYVGGMTGGSFSAVLLNIPGTPSASATAMDGYPMAARGEAGRALGVAITASFTGGMFSFLCLYLIAPLLAEVALESGFAIDDNEQRERVIELLEGDLPSFDRRGAIYHPQGAT